MTIMKNYRGANGLIYRQLNTFLLPNQNKVRSYNVPHHIVNGIIIKDHALWDQDPKTKSVYVRVPSQHPGGYYLHLTQHKNAAFMNEKFLVGEYDHVVSNCILFYYYSL
uniref:Uncharacterized protein n=1 Tax=Glossina brevipalpis TaxID=37001 RepID=A0A1A9WMU9_9MUSC